MDRGVHLGGGERDYNHATDSEYKRLRDEADRLYKKRNQLSQESQSAYKSGNKSRAHDLSEQAKSALAEAEQANYKAADYVFRENNADSAQDEIDLHGLYVKEAELILQNRLAEAIRTNQSHLRVIVGKGLHSSNGIAKLKPAIDQMCEESHLRHHIDPKNTGVLVIDLTNTQSSQVPNHWNNGPQGQGYYNQGPPQYQQQPHYQQQPQYQQQPNYNQQQNGESSSLGGIFCKIVCACINSS